MCDINSTVSMIIERRLLQNFEASTAIINNLYEISFGVIGFLIIIVGYLNFRHERIIAYEVRKHFENEKDELKKGLDVDLHKIINRYKQESQREEFLRNIIFKDLTKILASEIQKQNTDTLSELLNFHADRLEVVTKLTSGKQKEVAESLDRLGTGTYRLIISLQSFKDYLEILKNKNDIYIDEELIRLDNIMSKLNNNGHNKIS